MELAQAIEVPLLGAHPVAPDTGLVKYYTLASDLREYARFDSGEIRYRQPRYWHWKVGYNGTQDNNQWLRNVDSSPQTRRSNLLVPFDTCIVEKMTFSSRIDLDSDVVLRITIHEEPINSGGDINNSDTVTATIDTDDSDVVTGNNGKRFIVDLTARNIVLDNTKRYAMTIENIENGDTYRDPRLEISIQERVVQP